MIGQRIHFVHQFAVQHTTTAAAIEHILAYQHQEAAKATSDEARSAAHTLYDRAVSGLSRALALATSTPEAEALRDSIAFYKYLRAVLKKRDDAGSSSRAYARHEAIRQLADRSVMTVGVVDLLAHLPGSQLDVSILSDEFLESLRGTAQRNLAVEALRRLLEDRIQSRAKSNVVDARRFTERLDEAIRRYHLANETAFTTLEAMIALAKDVNAAADRGEDLNLNEEELAFYDALAVHDNAREVLGDANLVLLARQIAVELRQNISTDWVRREASRAKLRTTIRRVLRRAGYPPDKSPEAVRTVLEQAEALALNFSDEDLAMLRQADVS